MGGHVEQLEEVLGLGEAPQQSPQGDTELSTGSSVEARAGD